MEKNEGGFVINLGMVKRLLYGVVPVRLLPGKSSQALIDQGITHVYIRGVSRNGGESFILEVNQDKVGSMHALYSLKEGELALEEAVRSVSKKRKG